MSAVTSAQLYQLVVSQLAADGFPRAAQQVAEATQVLPPSAAAAAAAAPPLLAAAAAAASPAVEPMRLERLVNLGLQAERAGAGSGSGSSGPRLQLPPLLPAGSGLSLGDNMLDAENEVVASRPEHGLDFEEALAAAAATAGTGSSVSSAAGSNGASAGYGVLSSSTASSTSSVPLLGGINGNNGSAAESGPGSAAAAAAAAAAILAGGVVPPGSVLPPGGSGAGGLPACPGARQPRYATRFIATHKNICRVAAFSRDGRHVATASSDCSMKLLEVSKMKAHYQNKSGDMTADDLAPTRPVLRTYYAHTHAINSIDFHPFSSMFVTASADCTVKFFDYMLSTKKAARFIQDSHNVWSAEFHPSGEFLLVATDHNVVRLYDTATLKCFTSPGHKDHHFAAVTQATHSADGRLFASGSLDGQVKIWDGTTHRCALTIPDAHKGYGVNSVQFSLNSRYVLSSGRDASAAVWDVRTGRLLRQVLSGCPQAQSVHCTWTYNEDFIVTTDDRSHLVLIWDSRSGEQVQRLAGHNSPVTWITSSPVENAFISCSHDFRARYWASD